MALADADDLVVAGAQADLLGVVDAGAPVGVGVGDLEVVVLRCVKRKPRPVHEPELAGAAKKAAFKAAAEKDAEAEKVIEVEVPMPAEKGEGKAPAKAKKPGRPTKSPRPAKGKKGKGKRRKA